MPPQDDRPVETVAGPPPAGDDAPPGGGARLRRERARLMRRREEMLFHLGGLAYELHRRDLLGEPVARHRAGLIADLDERVRDIDDRLAAIDGERRARRTRTRVVAVGPVESGCCLACRAVFFDDARFCMQCGTPFRPPVPPAAAPADEAGRTAVFPAVGGDPGGPS
jgi:hypothetical protein